jgi:hypothetical protein
VINVRPYNQEEYNTSSPTEQFWNRTDSWACKAAFSPGRIQRCLACPLTWKTGLKLHSKFNPFGPMTLNDIETFSTQLFFETKHLHLLIYLQFTCRYYQFLRLYAWKGRGKKQSWPNLKSSSDNCLKVQRQTMKNLRQYSQCLAQVLKQAPSKHK